MFNSSSFKSSGIPNDVGHPIIDEDDSKYNSSRSSNKFTITYNENSDYRRQAEVLAILLSIIILLIILNREFQI